jgi:tripartite-type tricarboxylate transporter receptor subunit TctC
MNRRELMVGAGIASIQPAWLRAQDAYPSKTVRMVVPYAAGGPLDGLVRLVSDRLSKRINQPVIVDNRAGASGILGADFVAKAAPDGYTMLATVIDTQVNNAVLFKQLPYDPLKDFIPVTQLATAPAILVANSDLPPNSLQEFIAYAKANAGKLSYGSWGAGGIGHAITEALNKAQNLQMVHAPYKGEAPLVQDLLSKSIAVGAASVANTMQHIEKGSLKAYAISGTRRSNAVPNVPTFQELGLRDPIFATRIWLAVFAPAKTPMPIVRKMQTELRAALELPDVSKILVGRAFDPIGNTPEEFAAIFQQDFAVVTKLIRELGVEPQ